MRFHLSLKHTVTLGFFLLPSMSFALPVKNFSAVTEENLILRGAQPLGKASALVEEGITRVLIFKNDTKGEVEREKKELKEAGLAAHRIHHIPMEWKDIDFEEACEHTLAALAILEKASAAQEKIFFHCTAGEDRTGMLAGLFRLKHEQVSLDQVYQEELCDKSYADGNPNKPRAVVEAIHQGLTPLFFALAEEIQKSPRLTPSSIKKICQSLVTPDPADLPRCR